MEHRELPIASEAASVAAVAEWRAASPNPADREEWRVEFHPEATILHVRVGVSRGDAVDVFLDERGVFILVGEQGPEREARGVVIPMPGALDADRPWAELREGALTITLPRAGREQQRVPIAVRQPQQQPDAASAPFAGDAPHA